MRPLATISLIATATVVAASTPVSEAMAAPAMAIAPAGPGTNAQKHPVVEVPRTIKAIRRAAIGRIFVIAILASRRRTADIDSE
jgi:hypothetical protein